jgi:hypothetical protein
MGKLNVLSRMRKAERNEIKKTEKEIKEICRKNVKQELDKQQDKIIRDSAYQSFGVTFYILARDFGFDAEMLANLKDAIEDEFSLMQIGILGKEYNAYHTLNYLKENYNIDFNESKFDKKAKEENDSKEIKENKEVNEMDEETKTQQKENVCKLCGKSISGRKHFHEECVVNDAVETINSGNKLTAAHYNRLQAFGYTASDIRNIAQGRVQEIQQEILTDDEYNELKCTIGYIIENHPECKYKRIDSVIRYTVDMILKVLSQEEK